MLIEMKEVEEPELSGAVVETKRSSGCLIIKKKAAYGVEGGVGFSDSPSRSLFNSNKEKKRPRVVLSDSETSDELPEPTPRRKLHKLGNASVADNSGLIESKDFQIEKRVESAELDEKRTSKDVHTVRRRLILHRQNEDKRESVNGSGSRQKRDSHSETKSTISGIPMEDDEFDVQLSVSNENEEEDFEDPVRLQEKNDVLMVNKHIPMGISHRLNGHAEANDQKEPKIRVLDQRKPVLTHKSRDQRGANKKRAVKLSSSSVKGNESKNKRASFTEKQLLREKIKNMLLGAGWTIDYRPRRNRDYLDSVYISPTGTAYWSITKAYDALKKEEKDKSKSSGDFTPLPNEILNKLTRQTRKKIERELEKNRRQEDTNRKPKKVIVKKSCKSPERRLTEASDESSEYSSDNSTKNTLQKDYTTKITLRTDSQIVQERKRSEIGTRTLLVRGTENGLSSENNEFVPYSGNRTVLSWLIDSKTVFVGEEVNYMNLRKTRVMEEGVITNEGIQCGCCSKVITISRFELHAGSKLGEPYKNIFLKSGKSLVECEIDAWNKQEDCERKGFHSVDVDSGDPNDDTCGLCGDGGDLICCDGCPSTFHLSCLDMQMLPQGDWNCPNCACKYCEKVSRYCTKASGTTENSLLTCHLCEKKYHKSCSLEMDEEPFDSDDLKFSFCGHTCQELYSRFQKLLWMKHDLDSGFSWSLIHRSDPLPDSNYSERADCNSKVAVALLLMDECFLPIVDRRSGINLIHNVVYNCGSNFSRLNYSGFYTAILEKGDEMVCAASIRIHGTQLAEMPFIGTRHTYRRQGMCRRLLDAIESALASLEIEKLVIPAIEEHMNTWTNAFGFRPLYESHKQAMKAFNMLVFPGTDMLQKPLRKQRNILSKKGGGVSRNKEFEVSKVNRNYTVEIQPSRKKSDTRVLSNEVHDGNGIAIETNGLQNGDKTAPGITDEPQLQLVAKESVSVDAHSDCIVVQNGNKLSPVEPDVLQFLGKESGSVDANHSEPMVKENDVQDKLGDMDMND